VYHKGSLDPLEAAQCGNNVNSASDLGGLLGTSRHYWNAVQQRVSRVDRRSGLPPNDCELSFSCPSGWPARIGSPRSRPCNTERFPRLTASIPIVLFSRSRATFPPGQRTDNQSKHGFLKRENAPIQLQRFGAPNASPPKSVEGLAHRSTRKHRHWSPESQNFEATTQPNHSLSLV